VANFLESLWVKLDPKSSVASVITQPVASKHCGDCV